MNITLSKKTILQIIVLLWIVFSVVYIAWDIWSDFKHGQIISAYDQGKIDIINSLIERAEECEPITVTGLDKQVEVIATHCFSGMGEEL